jgi:methyl-accepting chemotaxis protein
MAPQSIRKRDHRHIKLGDHTHEQSLGVAQVAEAIGQMDTATQQNAALVEESAAAAESLKQQALDLVRAVGVFRINAGGL